MIVVWYLLTTALVRTLTNVWMSHWSFDVRQKNRQAADEFQYWLQCQLIDAIIRTLDEPIGTNIDASVWTRGKEIIPIFVKR